MGDLRDPLVVAAEGGDEKPNGDASTRLMPRSCERVRPAIQLTPTWLPPLASHGRSVFVAIDCFELRHENRGPRASD